MKHYRGRALMVMARPCSGLASAGTCAREAATGAGTRTSDGAAASRAARGTRWAYASPTEARREAGDHPVVSPEELRLGKKSAKSASVEPYRGRASVAKARPRSQLASAGTCAHEAAAGVGESARALWEASHASRRTRGAYASPTDAKWEAGDHPFSPPEESRSGKKSALAAANGGAGRRTVRGPCPHHPAEGTRDTGGPRVEVGRAKNARAAPR